MKKYISFIAVLLCFSTVNAMEPEGNVAKLRRVFSEPSLRQNEIENSKNRKFVRHDYKSKTVTELRKIWEPNGEVKLDEKVEKTTRRVVSRRSSTEKEEKPLRSPRMLSRKVSSFFKRFNRKSPPRDEGKSEKIQLTKKMSLSSIHGKVKKERLQLKYRQRSETVPSRPLSPRSVRHRSPTIFDAASKYYGDFIAAFSNSASRKDGGLMISRPEVDTNKTICRVFSMDEFEKRLSKLLVIYGALCRIISLHIKNSDIDSTNALSVQEDLEQLGEMHRKGQLLKKKLEKAKEEKPVRASLLRESKELREGFGREIMGPEVLESLCERVLTFVDNLEQLDIKSSDKIYIDEKFDVGDLLLLEDEKVDLFKGLRETSNDIKKTKRDSRVPEVIKGIEQIRKLLEKEQRDLETTGAEFIQSLERLQKTYYRVVKFATNQRDSLSPAELQQFAKKVESTLKNGENVSVGASYPRATITHPGTDRRSPSGLRKTRARAQTEVAKSHLRHYPLGS